MTSIYARGSLVALVLTSFVSLAFAQDQPTYTDPKEAGPDYALQGEYTGEIPREDGVIKYGVQIIALGDGKFRSVAHEGGLPGDGWKRGMERRIDDGQVEDGKLRIETDVVDAVVGDNKIVVLTKEGDEIATLKKVIRESPTLGKKAPEGAIVLFDGTNTDHWQNGEIVQENLLLAATETKRKFKDHSLHLEFRTPFKPHARGQARGNSGLYVHNRYEVQILDSFGLEGENNECGGIYQIAKPIVNMCYPPLTWQTYDVDFTAPKYDAEGKKTENARVTIKHNGVVIHDNLELPNQTPGKNQESPKPDGFYLQGHGNPVVFKNIWVVEK